jgi:hypothetical protein
MRDSFEVTTVTYFSYFVISFHSFGISFLLQLETLKKAVVFYF